MAKIGEIKNGGTTVYPRTIAEAVAVAGNTLADELEKKANKTDLIQEWFGTQSEFDALKTYSENTNYYII